MDSSAVKRWIAIWCLALCCCASGSAQVGPWKGKRCAVSLTYDDALNVHLDNVIPELDSAGFKATFYLSGYFPGLKSRLNDWRRAGADGHELGNHSIFHPCEGSAPGREWVQPDYDLNHYSMKRLLDEIAMANVLLESLDGRKVRTFAYPCGDRTVQGVSYVEGIQEDFIAERGVAGKTQRMEDVDLTDVGSYVISGQTGEELIALVKGAQEKRGLVVFLFHGVGGEHSINVSLEAHRQLIGYLRDHRDDIWVAPMVEIASYIRSQRP